MKYPDDFINKILQGDALKVCKTLPTESINCTVTSPPYWGLRDYGIEPIIWDGSSDCEHEWGNDININKENHHGQGKSTLRGGNVSPNENWNSGVNQKIS